MKIKKQRTAIVSPYLSILISLALLVMTFTACTSAPNAEQVDKSEVSSGTSLKKVTFDSCIGLETVTLEIGKDGTTSTPENSSWKPAYTFAGWYTDKSYTTEFANKGLSSDTTVFAKWTNNGKTVRTGVLDLNNVTEDISNQDEGWDWNATSKTLTLSGLTIDSAEMDADDSSVGLVMPQCPTAITDDDSASIHLHTPDCPMVTLVITDGSVNTVDITRATSAYYSTALYNISNLTIKSSGNGTPGTLNLTSAAAMSINVALYCEGDLTIESGEITAIAGDSAELSSNGIYVFRGNTHIKNGTITAVGGRSSEAYSDDAPIGSFGIHSDEIRIDGGTVTATGTLAALSLSTGILGNKDVWINGGHIIAKGDTAAVASFTNLTMENVIVNGEKTDTSEMKKIDLNQFSLHTLVDDNKDILKEMTITP